MFCTIEEAAEKLRTTTAEVEMMVAGDTLHEYRVGATRLVKNTDVEAAMAARPVAVAAVQAAPDRPADARSDPPPAQESEGPGHSVDISPPADVAIPSAQPESNRPREGRPLARPAAAPSPDAELAAAPSPDAEPVAAPSPDAELAAAPSPDAEPVAAPSPDAEPAAAPSPDAEPAAAPSPDAEPAAERDYDPAACRRCPARAEYRPMPRLRQAAASVGRRSLRQWMWMGIVDDQPHVLITLFAIVTGCIGALAAAAYLLTRVL
jgi:excisionase family DNA binding protein